MKSIFTSALLLLIAFSAKADLPFMPFQFELRTAKEIYLEGERVDFILTVTNRDPSRTWPLLLPGQMSAGAKLIYLRVWDVAANLYVLRAKEDRMMQMNTKQLGDYEIKHLKPGEKISYEFCWNDETDNVYSSTASHHIFDFPLFTGEYNVEMIYNPQGTSAGDTLYHFLNNTEGEQSTTKVNFLTGGGGARCSLKIAKSTLTNIRVQGYQLTIKHEREDGYFYYRSDDSSNYMHYVEATPGSTKASGRYYTYVKELPLSEFVTRFDNGNIRQYRKFKNDCPTEVLERDFNEMGMLIRKADRLQNGEVVIINYNLNGTINTEEIYTADAKQRKLFTYSYSLNGNSRRKTEVFENPCVMHLLEGKDETEN
jgi:hypothetical protein